MNKPLPVLILTALAMSECPTIAQPKSANYDEALVGEYTLPELLVAGDGQRIGTAEAWTAKRRPELLALFEQHVYGRTPTEWGRVTFETLQSKPDALGGKATRKIVRIALADFPAWQGMDVMLHIPNGLDKPAPCFAGLSFGGNHAVSTEADVPLSTRWMRASKDKGIVDNKATEASRGTGSSSWPLEMIIGKGFAIATAYYGDIEPDHAEGWKDGLRAALSKQGAKTDWQNGQWGAIGAWAWGLSRILDYLETDNAIDAKHCAVIGHSRLGKTSLWAGMQDERFAFVISNNSGEGGAALMRRNFGETTAIITKSFPHWFTRTYSEYAGNPAACPIDKHMLIALAAPRPVYVASAVEDEWADPKGEFLSAKHAEPAFALFGKKGLGVDGQPPLNTSVGGFIGYHIRTGKHGVEDFDWEQYLKFASRHFGLNR